MRFSATSGDVWPLTRAEPSVEGVIIASISLAFNLNFWLIDTSIKNPIGWIFGIYEGRNWDAPRNLAGDVPVLKLTEVIDEYLFLASRMEFDFPFLKYLYGAFSKRFDVNKPLLFKERLDNGVALIAVTDGVLNLGFAS